MAQETTAAGTSFHSQKGRAFQEKPPADIREEKKEGGKVAV